jgi:riboflavin biosynthesis pyrimidine reductase
MHDAIMIGIGTAVNDDPQLNSTSVYPTVWVLGVVMYLSARHLPLPQNGQIHPLPRPVILDTDLRLPLTCKLLKNYAAGSGRQPWLVTRTPASSSINAQEWNYRRSSLEEAGARVILVEDGISEGWVVHLHLRGLVHRLISVRLHHCSQHIVSSTSRGYPIHHGRRWGTCDPIVPRIAVTRRSHHRHSGPDFRRASWLGL